MKLAIGTKIESCNKVWIVKSIGRLYYHLAVQGSEKLKGYTFEIPKAEAHADIASGIAKVIA
jgi:hypothetical protein